MTTCPKCGFQNKQPQATDCPKCGLIYAKFQKAESEKRWSFDSKRELNSDLREAIGNTDVENSRVVDIEPHKDSESYPMVDNLSLFFIGFAGILVIFTIVEAKYIWGLLTYLNDSFKMFTTSDKWIISISVIFLGVMQASLFLAIGGILRIGKDIADNTRATRNYLSQIARKNK